LSFKIKRQGYLGPVIVKVEGLPRDFARDEAIIPAGQDTGTLAVTAPVNVREEDRLFEVKVVGVGGRVKAEAPVALRLRQAPSRIHVNRALVHFQNNRFQEALEEYNKAIGSNPNDAGLYSDRSWVWSKMERYDQALADADKAIRLDPRHAMFFNN